MKKFKLAKFYFTSILNQKHLFFSKTIINKMTDEVTVANFGPGVLVWATHGGGAKLAIVFTHFFFFFFLLLRFLLRGNSRDWKSWSIDKKNWKERQAKLKTSKTKTQNGRKQKISKLKTTNYQSNKNERQKRTMIHT